MVGNAKKDSIPFIRSRDRAGTGARPEKSEKKKSRGRIRLSGAEKSKASAVRVCGALGAGAGCAPVDSSHLHLCLVAASLPALCRTATVEVSQSQCGQQRVSVVTCESMCVRLVFFPLPLRVVVRVYGANSSGFAAAELSAGLANDCPV